MGGGGVGKRMNEFLTVQSNRSVFAKDIGEREVGGGGEAGKGEGVGRERISF